MNRERLVQIGKFLNCRLIIHRNVENDIPWTTEEKMIRELYDNYLDLLKQNQNLEQALDDIEKICNSIPIENSICDIGKIHDIEVIIQKAKGDVK